MRSVEVRLTESLSRIEDGQPVMRHGRFFINALSDEVLGLLLGLKFCGVGGLMVDSAAELEEESADGSARFIRMFRPLGSRFASALAGCFNVHQELMEHTAGQKGTSAAIKITFSSLSETHLEPAGSFLWLVEPMECAREQGALWTELINTPETVSRRIPGLRIGRGKKSIFRLGHNRLIGKSAQRIADILNTGDYADLPSAHAVTDRLRFNPKKCQINSERTASCRTNENLKQEPRWERRAR